MSAVMAAAATAGLAIATVALWTARVALTSRKRESAAAALAAVEATVFVSAVARLMRDLDNPVQLAAYATGVAAGTLAAMRVLRLIEPSVVKVDVVVPGSADDLLRLLHENGWPTTTIPASGLTGPATSVSVTTSEDRLAALCKVIAEAGDRVFWTTTELRSARSGRLPAGFAQATAPSYSEPRTAALSGPSTRSQSAPSGSGAAA